MTASDKSLKRSSTDFPRRLHGRRRFGTTVRAAMHPRTNSTICMCKQALRIGWPAIINCVHRAPPEVTCRPTGGQPFFCAGRSSTEAGVVLVARWGAERVLAWTSVSRGSGRFTLQYCTMERTTAVQVILFWKRHDIRLVDTAVFLSLIHI